MATDVSYFEVEGDPTTYQFNDPDAETALAALNQRLQTAEGNITTLGENVTDVQGDVATLQGDVATLQGDVSDVQNEVSELREDVQYKIYNSVEDLGLTVGSATIAGAWAAMSANSILIATGNDFTSSQVPTQLGTVEIVKGINDTRGWIYFYGKSIDVGDYRMGLGENSGPIGTWVKIMDKESIIQEAKIITGITVSANGSQAGTVSVAKSGYTPFGVIGTNTTNGYAIPSACYVSGTTLYYRITNSHQTANVNNATLTVNILYLKN